MISPKGGVNMRLIFLFLLMIFSLLVASILFVYITSPKERIGEEKIAVIEVKGVISLDEPQGFLSTGATTPERFKRFFERALADRSVKAILIEINSPGGSVVASDEIASIIKSANKPVVAWIGEIGTSGAYYVASACDYIVASKGSLTGSIGVISIFTDYSGLLKKLGINVTVIKAGKYKDMGSGYRPLTKEEIEMLENISYQIYDMFIEEVAKNRNLSKDYVRKIAEGRLYTGVQAKEVGLVDEVGTKEDAIKIAGKLANITGKPKVVYYREKTFLQEILGIASTYFGYGFGKALLEYAGVPESGQRGRAQDPLA